MTVTTLEPPPVVDGRTQRRARSFDRAVDAVLDLIGDGIAAPTAQQIADRSGISIRTVFRLTDDVESIHAAAVHRQGVRTAALYTALPADGALRGRIDALVENRAAIFEAISPVRRVAERLAPGSESIAAGLAWHHRLLRSQVASVFGPELSTMSASRRRQVQDATSVAASWGTWEQLRRVQGLSRVASARVMRTLLAGVLEHGDR